MPLSYVAIDFETANSQYSSACSVGLTKVVNSQIIDSFHALINPEEPFSESNCRIHGIYPQDVTDAPTIGTLADKLFRFIDGLPLVAHNAPFDMKVLQKSLTKYGYTFPKLSYFCSLALSRRFLNLPSNRLNIVAANYGISFHHHLAADDSRVCAEIILHLFHEQNIHDLTQLCDQWNYQMGAIGTTTYQAFRRKSRNYFPEHPIKASSVHAKTDVFDPQHPLYQKVIVFTGELQEMTRESAYQKVVDCGGINGNSVTKQTNYLVVGTQDKKLLRGQLKSSKQRKAEQLAEQGQSIRILTETEFLKLV
ncbi:MAG: exonuclease domain-containing protein [Sporolactobacillus sp.]